MFDYTFIYTCFHFWGPHPLPPNRKNINKQSITSLVRFLMILTKISFRYFPCKAECRSLPAKLSPSSHESGWLGLCMPRQNLMRWYHMAVWPCPIHVVSKVLLKTKTWRTVQKVQTTKKKWADAYQNVLIEPKANCVMTMTRFLTLCQNVTCWYFAKFRYIILYNVYITNGIFEFFFQRTAKGKMTAWDLQ